MTSSKSLTIKINVIYMFFTESYETAEIVFKGRLCCILSAHININQLQVRICTCVCVLQCIVKTGMSLFNL